MPVHDNLSAPEVIADPYPYFHQLRAEDPVHWNPLWGGWVLTRHDDVQLFFQDRRLSADRMSEGRAMRRLHISVDRGKCVGSTTCVNTARGVFALDEAGKSSVIDPQGASEEEIMDAAESCPVGAITVEDAETGERLFPLEGVFKVVFM